MTEVPKFLSFKRPADPGGDTSKPVKRPRPHSEEREHPSREPGRYPREHSRHHDSHRHRDQERRQKVSTDTSHSHQSPLPAPAPLASDLYFIDRKGDIQNWTYQRLHKYAVPEYRRVGYGNVLGLDTRFKIDRHASVQDVVHIIVNGRASSQNNERALLKRRKLNPLPDLRILARDGDLDPASDFVALRPPKPFRRAQAAVETTLPESVNHESCQPLDQDLVYTSSESEREDLDLDAQIRKRNVELSRKTKLEPTNIKAWLDLVDHQEQLIRPATSNATWSTLSNTERRSLADLRIHILEKAGRSVSADDKASRETLLCHLFAEASFVWDQEKLVDKLHDALRDFPASLTLWTMFLNAAQTKSSAFCFEQTKASYIGSLRSLQSARSSLDKAVHAEAEDMQLYVLLRYTSFLRESGHDELSTAIWQALFEYHLRRPVHLLDNHNTTDILREFESFWESEAPRFGEQHSQGWCKQVAQPPVLDEPSRDAEEQTLDTSHPFRSFANLEHYLEHTWRLPGRTTEEEGSEDPFHIIFYSDIEEVLKATSTIFTKDGLIDALLCYAGLPARASSSMTRSHDLRVHSWRCDPFLSGGLLGGANSVTSSGTALVEKFETSTQSLFTQYRNVHGQKSASADVMLLVRRYLEGLTQTYPNDETLAEYYLAFAQCYYPDEAFGIAKATVKRLPTSLRLYNACAIIAAHSGQDGKATKIWTGALQLIKSLPAEKHHAAVLIWHSWTWHLLREGEMQAALLRLCFFDETSELEHSAPIPSSVKLRAQKTFSAGFEHALSQGFEHLAADNADCLALLAYLDCSEGLAAGVNVIDHHCAIVNDAKGGPSSQLLLELLHQAKARLLTYHIQQKRPYKPGFVRGEISASIKLFPTNTMFLALYKENEARFRIDDRVRTMLRDVETSVDTTYLLVRRSFEIDQEMARLQTQSSGSTAESVRAAFAKALLEPASPLGHCKLLWTRWLRFEEGIVRQYLADDPEVSSHGSKVAIKKWKEVFLGGLYKLPWAKDWILEGLEHFDSSKAFGWSRRDLKGLVGLLQERELRVRGDVLLGQLDDLIANSL